MKKEFSLIVAIVGLSLTLNQSLLAQTEFVAGKLFYTELGGPGVIMSANFDSRFNSNTRLGLGYRLGAGFGIGEFNHSSGSFYNDQVRRTYYSFPVGLNYILGKPHRTPVFEVGAAVTYLTREVSLFNYDVEKPGHVIGCITFMFRLMPVNGGFSFRVGFTPVIGTAGDLFPMGAIGFGYAF